MLQQHLSDHQFYPLLRCVLYQRFEGTCYNHTHHLFWTLSLFRMFRWFEDIFFGRRMGTGFHLTEDLFVAGRNQNSIFKEITFWPRGYNTEIYYLPSAHTSYINRLMPEQNSWHFADDIFKCIFFNENLEILIQISLYFAPKEGWIENISAVVQVMIWCLTDTKPLPEPI